MFFILLIYFSYLETAFLVKNLTQNGEDKLKKVRTKNNKTTGLSNRAKKLLSCMIIDWEKLSSTNLPKISPMTRGAAEKPFLSIKYPTRPAANITQTSNIEDANEYEPIIEKINTAGHNSFLGINATKEKNLAPINPINRKPRLAISIAPKIAYTNSGVSLIK